jgi:exodeoxyribonuclease VII large subunit
VDVQQARVQSHTQRVDLLLARLHNQRPQARLARDRERLLHLQHRLTTAIHAQTQQHRVLLERTYRHLLTLHPRTRLPLLAQRLNHQQQRLQRAIEQRCERDETRLHHLGRALHAVSPLATLERGYAILFEATGQVLRSVQHVAIGTPLRARLADGELALRVSKPGDAA